MSKTAELHRMVMRDHLCPYGLKAKDLLERHGFEIDDHHLGTREDVEAFMAKHDVETTPQIWIGSERVGGYNELREHLGDTPDDGETTSYKPVVAIFSLSALMALAVSWAALGDLLTLRAFESFIAIAMTLLAAQKLTDVERFSTMFLNYDLLAQRWVRYGYLYPFGEAIAGVLMLAGALVWIAAPVSLFIGTIGAVSVVKAVYVDGREIRCACVGGNSRVPLGFVSLTENLMMIAMGIWMLAKVHILAG